MSRGVVLVKLFSTTRIGHYFGPFFLFTLLNYLLSVFSLDSYLNAVSILIGNIISHVYIIILALLAKFIGFILWVLTFIDFYPGAPIAIRYIMCLFPNTGLMFCLLVVQQYERKSG